MPFFKRVCAGRATDDLIFVRDNGTAWDRNFQTKPMLLACARAKIEPLGFNQLRHTWASHAVMNGTPLLVVAKNLGHRDTRMVEKHYGHLAESYLKKAVNAGAPRFGVKPDKKVVGIGASHADFRFKVENWRAFIRHFSSLHARASGRKARYGNRWNHTNEGGEDLARSEPARREMCGSMHSRTRSNCRKQ